MKYKQLFNCKNADNSFLNLKKNKLLESVKTYNITQNDYTLVYMLPNFWN